MDWLVDSDESKRGEDLLNERMLELFSKVTWPTEKREVFVNEVVDGLVDEFHLLAYFHDYLMEHIGADIH